MAATPDSTARFLVGATCVAANFDPSTVCGHDVRNEQQRKAGASKMNLAVQAESALLPWQLRFRVHR